MLFFVALAAAFTASYCLQKSIRAASDWSRTGLALIGAGAGLLIFFLLFESDGITNAAALTLSPLFFAFLVIPSAIGVHIAGKPSDLK